MRVADYDVVVIGGGPAGSATAIRLANRGHSVAVVDQGRRAVEHYETLSPEIRGPLLELGVWDVFESDGHVPSTGTISMWGSTVPSHIDHMTNPFQVGWHVHRRRFDRMLLDHASACGAQICRGTKFLSVTRIGRSWKLKMRFHGKTVSTSARFVVDATGRNSVVARQIEANRDAIDDLVALAGIYQGNTPRTPPDSHNAARLIVESVESGWCYAVPSRDKMYCVLLASGKELPRTFNSRVTLWKDSLKQTHLISGRIGEMTPTGFHVMLANTSRLAVTAGNGWVAVGDAALAIDPLSGQGLLNAFAGSALATRLIITALADRREVEDARDQYQEFIDSKWRFAAEESREVYCLERRWERNRFWRRRHQVRRVRDGVSQPVIRSKPPR